MGPHIKTLILEDRYIDVLGLKRILDQIKEVVVVAECRTPQDAITKTKDLKPDFFIVDGEIYDNKKAGEQFVKEIRKNFPFVKILGLTQYPECIEPLRHAGCNHVVNKKLIDNQTAAEQHIREVLNSPLLSITESYPPPNLSELEDKVLRLIASGFTDPEIKNLLSMKNIKSAKRVRESLMQKFSARKSTELVSLAYRTKYFSPDDDIEDNNK